MDPQGVGRSGERGVSKKGWAAPVSASELLSTLRELGASRDLSAQRPPHHSILGANRDLSAQGPPPSVQVSIQDHRPVVSVTPVARHIVPS